MRHKPLFFDPKINWVFAEEDASFTVTRYFPDRSLVFPGISLTSLLFNERLALELYYDGEFRGNYSDHSYGGRRDLDFSLKKMKKIPKAFMLKEKVILNFSCQI